MTKITRHAIIQDGQRYKIYISIHRTDGTVSMTAIENLSTEQLEEMIEKSKKNIEAFAILAENAEDREAKKAYKTAIEVIEVQLDWYYEEHNDRISKTEDGNYCPYCNYSYKVISTHGVHEGQIESEYICSC